MESYTWRPALVARRREVGVSATGFAEGSGPVRHWADLDGIGWAFDQISGTVVVGLRLRWGRREVVLGYRGQGPVPHDCARMLRAVLTAVAAARPDLVVEIGHGGRTRRSMFALGVAFVALGQVGVVLGLWWLITRGFGEALGPGIAGTFVTAMGVGLALANRPGVALPRVPMRDFITGFDLPPETPGAD